MDERDTKRKRDDRSNGGNGNGGGGKERKVKARQEEMEDEFRATYLPLTAFYKYLEVVHLESPLLLPRTLKYRGEAKSKLLASSGNAASATKPPRRSTDELSPTGGALSEFKVGVASETLGAFRSESQRIGLLVSVLAAAKKGGARFADNRFELLATSLLPAFCAKELTLGRQFIRSNVGVYLLLFQVVDLAETGSELAKSTAFAFAAPATPGTTFLGKELLTQAVDGRPPLFANVLRVDVTRWRNGTNCVDLPAVSSAVKGVVQLQFRLQWNPSVKAKRIKGLHELALAKLGVTSSDETTAVPLAKKDEMYHVDSPNRNHPTKAAPENESAGVYFHFLYHSMLRRMSEKRSDYSCSWCDMYAGSLRGLVAHLVCSHSRLRFQVAVGHDNMAHIYVTTAQSEWKELNSNVTPTACELDVNDDATDHIEQHYCYFSPKKHFQSAKTPEEKKIEERMHEFDELEELTKEQPAEFYAPLLQRQYFHSRTGAVVLDHEKDYDSDDDVDEEWIIKQSEKLLDEFEDVALEEKEFMKKWNRHVKENRILADFMVASSCRLFAKLHGKWLLDHGLRYNFLLHLFNLWDNSLLNSRAIIDCMLIVDHIAVLEETKPKSSSLANGAESSPATTATAASAH